MVEVFVKWRVGELKYVRAWQLPRVPVAGDLLLVEETKTWLRVYQVVLAETPKVLAAVLLDTSWLDSEYNVEVPCEST